MPNQTRMTVSASSCLRGSSGNDVGNFGNRTSHKEHLTFQGRVQIEDKAVDCALPLATVDLGKHPDRAGGDLGGSGGMGVRTKRSRFWLVGPLAG